MADTDADVHADHAEAARLQQVLVEAIHRAAEVLRHARDPQHQVRTFAQLPLTEQYALRAGLDRIVVRLGPQLWRLIQLRGGGS